VSCCGKRREAAKRPRISRPIKLRFLGEGTVEVRGIITGKTYTFSETSRELEIDRHDARGFKDAIFAVVQPSAASHS
jgi:hypothetical protein